MTTKYNDAFHTGSPHHHVTRFLNGAHADTYDAFFRLPTIGKVCEALQAAHDALDGDLK